MQAAKEFEALKELITLIDVHTSGLTYPADERSLLVLGCLDVAIEHQAAVALLHSASLYGSEFALLRVLAESLVRGLWLKYCATDAELQKFQKGKVDQTFDELVKGIEAWIAV